MAEIATVALAGLSTIQGVQQAKEQSKASAAQARNQLAVMEQKRLIGERTEKSALRQRLATRRAMFGSSGLVASHSADAVLDGFRQESEQRIADGRWFHNQNVQGVSQSIMGRQAQSSASTQNAILGGLGTMNRTLTPYLKKLGEE